MKTPAKLRLAAFLAVGLLATAALAGCEKHAFSSSTNVFRYTTGGSAKTVTTDLSLKRGTVYHVYAASNKGVRLTGGEYSGSTQDEAVVSVSPGTFEGDGCLELTTKASGSADVTLRFEVMGFDLHKTITVKVN